jgi:2-dehydro-3-deoxyphosphooctonate aldolase (KDO 8-P synthase)
MNDAPSPVTNPDTRLGPHPIGRDHPLVLLAGPCVIESEAVVLRLAEWLARIAEATGVAIVFKASFDKANRSSIDSFRGPGIEAGLAILEKAKRETGLPLVTDVHEAWQCQPVAEIVDVLQIPAFLCRQTDLLLAAAATGRSMNVKKAQFLAPGEMRNVVAKVRAAGCHDLALTERGTFFGYHQLVNDMRSIPRMQALGVPVIFDATHSVQEPGGLGNRTGGDRTMIPVLASAAMAAGADGFFMEVHDDPDHALSDGPNMLPIQQLEGLLRRLLRIREATREG